MRAVNEAGKSLVLEFEQIRLKAYQDVGGIWTIGVGETGAGISEGVTWTEEYALQSFDRRLSKFADGVETALAGTNVSDNQFAALVAFSYNVGLSAFEGSTLLKKLYAGDYEAAATEFARWNKVHGQVSNGLTRRRQAEHDLFVQP